ncbi:MAG: HIT domain-containing protein [Candidatus Gracilibacteria bacterium]|nr:HIT domain-containing protein [Candidatus Gracilibacteria bacterium]
MPSIFTKIMKNEIPAELVYEDDQLIVIKDIQPKAKTHLLIIPRKEIPTINDILPEDGELIAHMFFVAKKIACDAGVEAGYKLHFNVGKKGGQEVMHIHLHLLSEL